MPQFKADVLEANITLIKGDSIYSQYGNWPVWAVVILLSAVGVFVRVKK